MNRVQKQIIKDALDELHQIEQRVTAPRGQMEGEMRDSEIEARWRDRQAEPRRPQMSETELKVEKLEKMARQLNKMLHDNVVAQQAAWIEWRHGKGAEAAMKWIENGLVGPGLIPGENEPYGKEAQAYFDANRSDPFPACPCGRPSNQLWMGHGACCNEHMRMIQEKEKAGTSNE